MAPSHRRTTPTMGPSNLFAIMCLFWLFSSTALAVRAVLGIDFGTEYIKATLVKPGIPLEIVLTKDSRRKEVSAVAFKPLRDGKAGGFPERVYGSDAIALAPRFPSDVYPNLKALLGLPARNSKVLEYGTRYPSLKIRDYSTRGTVAFRSQAFPPEELAFTLEEMIAMELQSIQRNAEALAGKGTSVKDVVITVPPFFSIEEKRAIEFAADLAGMRVLSLTSDGLAVGLNYATTRTFPSVTEGGKPEYHLVFDMGAGSTKATVLKFQGRTVKDVGKYNKTIQEVQVLGAGWDRKLGGDALNTLVFYHMVKSFTLSKAGKAASVKGELVKSHGRVAAKLWKEAERVRQVLSANTEAQASFEGLYEDLDFRYKTTRADFEKLASEQAERVRPVIETALKNAKLEIDDLDSVILHGGVVRTPFVQKLLEEIFGSADKIRSNVNADEAAVFGAGFKGAELSPSFRVKEIKTYDIAVYPVGMKWTNAQGKDQQQQLFGSESLMGKVKTISFQNQNNFQITFYQLVSSWENVSPGSEQKDTLRVSMTNVTASIDELKDKHGCNVNNILTKLSIRLNPDNGEVEITKAIVQCEKEEEDKKDSVVDSVKGLFGFGSKKDEQQVLDDSGPVEVAGSESATTSTPSASGTTSASPSASEDAKDTKSKQTKRLVEIPVAFESERAGYPQLGAEDISRIKERLAAFDDSDRSRRLREESLNLLEAFTYKLRDMIDEESFVTVSTDAERASLEEKGKSTSEWLYGDGAEASRDELKARLKEMKDIVNPIEKRKEEASQRPAKITAMQDTLNQTANFIESLKEQIKAAEEASSSAALEPSSSSTATAEPSSTTSTNEFVDLEDEDETTLISSSTTTSESPNSTPTTPEYTTEDLNEVISIYESVKTWFTTKLEEQDKLPASADPVLLVKDLTAKSQELTKATVNVLMKAMKTPENERAKWGSGGGESSRSSSSTKSKTKPTKSKSKNKKAKATKAKGAKGAKATEADPSNGKKGKVITFEETFGENVLPSEEEILAMLGDDWMDDEKFGEEVDGDDGKEKQKSKKEHISDEL